MGIFAGLLTILWFVCIALYWVGYRTEIAGIDKILLLTPEQFGSFLSGAFAPVAFFWLAYSVRMQKQELQLQREELAATRVVLSDQQIAQSESAKYAKDLHEATMKQNEIALGNLEIEKFRTAINNFYDVCMHTSGISIYTNEINNTNLYNIYLSEKNRELSYHEVYSCYRISLHIDEAIFKIREKNTTLKLDGNINKLNNLLSLICVIEEIAIRNYDVSLKEIYNAHGFGILKNSLTNICNIAGIKNHRTVGNLE